MASTCTGVVADTDSKPVFRFADGYLHIDAKWARMRLAWQPEPLAQEHVIGARRWRSFCPEFRLLRPAENGTPPPLEVDVHVGDVTQEAANQKEVAFASFREQIPPGIVRVVEPFGSHQWALMILLQNQPLALDLAKSNPVLAYALANSDQLRGTRPQAAAVQALWHCHRKQRVLLEWLGFPGTEAIVRLFKKITPGAAAPSALRRLKNSIVADDRVQALLTHLPTINTGVLDLVTNGHVLDLVTPKLLMEALTTQTAVGAPSAGDMILEGVALLREIQPNRAFRPLSSTRQARRFLERADVEYQAYLQRKADVRIAAEHAAREVQQRRLAEDRAGKERENRLLESSYPLPPIPGTPDIVPVASVEQLRAESKEQDNCVRHYGTRILIGYTYIYSVLAPERATLAIVRGVDGNWRISDLKAKRNRKARDATVRHVNAWLAGHSLSV